MIVSHIMITTVYVDITKNGQPKGIAHEHDGTGQWLGGVAWITLTCSAGMMGYEVGEDIGVFTGAMCAIVTGVMCIDLIQWGCRV